MNNDDRSLQSIGQFLRQARQEEGLDLYDVSDRLRIRPAYLFAIEEGDYDAMPGATYALGFVRSYADCLGFDGEEVASAVKRQFRSFRVEPDIAVIREPIPETRWPSMGAIAGSLAIAAVAYGLWVATPSFKAREVANVGAWPGEIGAYLSEIVARTETSVTPDPKLAGDTRTEVTTTPVVVSERTRFGEDAFAAPLLPEMLTMSEPDSEPVQFAGLLERPDDDLSLALIQSLESDEAEASPSQAVYGVTNGTSRITLVAKEPSWIQVQSTSEDYRWTRTLDAGERYLMPDRRDLALWTGNAGGLDVIIDGRSIGPLGARGSVMRDVILLPEELLADAR